MRRFAPLVLMLSVMLLGSAKAAAPRPPVTLDLIREAMVSLARLMHDTGDKLERHEYRERQLGDQVKRSLATLVKKSTSSDMALESLGSAIAQMDGRLRRAEEEARQREEHNLERTEKLMERLERMESWQKTVEELVRSQNKVPGSSEEADRTTKVHQDMAIVRIASTVDRIESELLAAQQKLSSDRPGLDEEWKADVMETLSEIRQQLEETQQVASQAAACSNESRAASAVGSNVEHLTNETLDRLEDLRRDLTAVVYRGVGAVEAKMDGLRESVENVQHEVVRAVTEGNQMLYTGVTTSYEQLRSEVQALSKVEKVLIQTADNVLDTKRRIEYGIHQILLEVGDLVKLQAKDLNNTFNRRFDDISATILDNQTGALANLSSKIEQEISQVWRQIGTMYNQLTASTVALDRLQHQTEQYVNGSLKTMDSMEGKVGQITGRMGVVDENLNYLLGRLSFVTTEFNDIKVRLGAALDNIRNSFLEAQEKINDIGPARKPIPEGEIVGEDNELFLSEDIH